MGKGVDFDEISTQMISKQQKKNKGKKTVKKDTKPPSKMDMVMLAVESLPKKYIVLAGCGSVVLVYGLVSIIIDIISLF